MQLKNKFTLETRELYMWNYECFWCGKNHWDCIHHIHGRVSTSPYNACPINNFECHIGNGKLMTFEGKRKLSLKNKAYLNSVGYEPTKEDKVFLNKYKQYYA